LIFRRELRNFFFRTHVKIQQLFDFPFNKVNRKHSKINESVLGIKVTSIVEKKDKFNDSIDTIAKFGLSIFNTLVTQIERTSIKKGYYDNVIDIVLNDTIDNFELKLSESKKQELFNLGYSFTQKFLEK
jgi:hypothetical protein